MRRFLIIITDNTYSYGNHLIRTDALSDNEMNLHEAKSIAVDCALVHYLIKEITLSLVYRKHFVRNWSWDGTKVLVLILTETSYNLIDYKWNERVYYMVRERCELDHALSWLSTLGGAFSALGDYFPNCADTAGKISMNQLKLALRLGDPNIAARCRLYFSLSLIQKKRFKLARYIIYKEFTQAKAATIIDVRLLNMCRGIWSKLQYEHKIHKCGKKGIRSF